MTLSVVTTLNSCSSAVDKSKAKASSRQQTPQQPATLPSQANGPPDVVPGSASSDQKRAQQLKGLLAASNCRFEAVAVALQHWMAKVSAWLLFVSGKAVDPETYLTKLYSDWNTNGDPCYPNIDPTPSTRPTCLLKCTVMTGVHHVPQRVTQVYLDWRNSFHVKNKCLHLICLHRRGGLSKVCELFA